MDLLPDHHLFQGLSVMYLLKTNVSGHHLYAVIEAPGSTILPASACSPTAWSDTSWWRGYPPLKKTHTHTHILSWPFNHHLDHEYWKSRNLFFANTVTLNAFFQIMCLPWTLTSCCPFKHQPFPLSPALPNMVSPAPWKQRLWHGSLRFQQFQMQ